MKLSNPDKEYFPGVSKRRVVEHYGAVAAEMLPHVANRPLTLQRFPNGVLEKGFMQKNASKHFPDFVGRFEVVTRNTTTVHPVVTTAEGLQYLAGQGTITFHIPDSRVDAIGRPDRFVLDLDPIGDDAGRVAEVARAGRAVLARFGMEPTPMITGSSGIHLVAELERTVSFKQTSLMSRAVAGLVVAEVPELATTAFLKRDRGGKVFVDWLRNRPGQTAVAPWSLRPDPAAPVAVPIRWAEVGTVAPDGVTIDTVAQRLSLEIPWAIAIDVAPLIDPIIDAARSAGVDLETPFDRFGRMGPGPVFS